jgi:hypothetical protein
LFLIEELIPAPKPNNAQNTGATETTLSLKKAAAKYPQDAVKQANPAIEKRSANSSFMYNFTLETM